MGLLLRHVDDVGVGQGLHWRMGYLGLAAGEAAEVELLYLAL